MDLKEQKKLKKKKKKKPRTARVICLDDAGPVLAVGKGRGRDSDWRLSPNRNFCSTT